jgi:hypothetical protein
MVNSAEGLGSAAEGLGIAAARTRCRRTGIVKHPNPLQKDWDPNDSGGKLELTKLRAI